MFSTLVNKLEQALNAECEILRFSESLRSEGSHGASSPIPPSPSLTSWRIHDQCGVVVRMYAEYESFFVGLVEEWVKRLPSLYTKYSDLPEDLRTHHRIGIATILQKLGSDQYSGITESAAARALAGVFADDAYGLLPDAFWVNCNANLRLETTKDVIKKVGAGNPSFFLDNARPLRSLLAEIDSTSDAELKRLVEARNVASHDDIDEVEGIDIHEQRARFLVAFARGLAAYFEMLITERRIATGAVMYLGEVIHSFSNSVSGVEATSAGLLVCEGTIVLAMTPTECFRAVVQSIEVEKVSRAQLETAVGLKVGLKTSPALPKKAKIVLVQE